jgi:hypothetical protein
MLLKNEINEIEGRESLLYRVSIKMLESIYGIRGKVSLWPWRKLGFTMNRYG